MESNNFSTLQLSEALNKAVEEMGFTATTPIQEQAIPLLLEGHDVTGQAQTGTGKTAAFGIPILEKINIEDNYPQALILCPTRELALQVADQVNQLGRYIKKLKTLAVYGGDSIEKQIKQLKKGTHIVVGTPGRVIDHINRGTLALNQLQMVVLDEADEMLDMGFREDIEKILKSTPEDRQTCLFSATLPPSILALQKKYQQDPQMVKVASKTLTVDAIEQYYYDIKSPQKLQAMMRLMDTYQLNLTLVFCNTKRMVDQVVSSMQAEGYAAEGLHGDMSQAQRNRVMEKFRNNRVKFLVATDVAARGIDVNNIEAVFNYDFPQDSEYYVHRIGRTGRAGKSGLAFTFVTSQERSKLRTLTKITNGKIEQQKLPSAEELKTLKRNQFLAQLQKTINKEDLGDYYALAEELTENHPDYKSIIAGLLKMNLGKEEAKIQELAAPRETYGRDSHRRETNGKPSNRKAINGKATKGKGFNGSSENMTRLFLNLGKKSKISPGDILGSIAGETGLPGKVVGNIDMYDKFSFVEVHTREADEVVEKMQNKSIKGKKANMEVAKNPVNAR